MSAKPHITDRLRAVSSTLDLDRVLRELSSRRHRWKRDLVLYYLPPRWHHAADRYFVDGVLSPPAGAVVSPEDTAPAKPLEEVLRNFVPGEQPEPSAARDERVRPDELPPPPRPAHTRDVVALVLNALFEEIRCKRRQRVDRFRLTDGVCTGARGEKYVYRFRWGRTPDFHVPGDLRLPDGRKYSATVLGQAAGESEYELALDTDVGEAIPQATFYVDPLFLLKQQYWQLHELADMGDRFKARAEELLDLPRAPTTVNVSDQAPQLAESQRYAIALALAAQRSYVWGPPGTGKTTALGELCRRAVAAGKRVLIVSPNNVAVDEAITAASRGSRQKEAFVRFGRVGPKVVKEEIHLDSHLERLAAAAGLLQKARDLAASACQEAGTTVTRPGTVRASLEAAGEAAIHLRRHGKSAEAREVQRQQQAMRRAFRAPERTIMANAKVIATTATLADISPMMSGQMFDLIIVDEASVMRTSDIVLLVLKREGQLAVFGDPQQLPPIINSKSREVREWLGRNPFRLAGIESPSQAQGSACAFLDRQHRMAPPIRSLVSDLFYSGRLTDGRSPRKGRVIVLDTSETAAQALRHALAGGGTRENPIHRSIIAGVLDELTKRRPTWSIKVLTPFRGQRKALIEESRTGRHGSMVHINTVHSSQGSEAEAVILDLTVAPSKARSTFLDDNRNPDIPFLVNVALSRAKRLLIVIAHVDYCRQEYANGIVDRVLRNVATEDWLRVPPTLAVSRPMRELLMRDTRLSVDQGS